MIQRVSVGKEESLPFSVITIFILILAFSTATASQANSADFGQVGVIRTSTPNESPALTLDEKPHVVCDNCSKASKFSPIVVVQKPNVVLRVSKLKDEPVITEEHKVLYFPLNKTTPKGGDDIKLLTGSQLSLVESIAIKGFTCDIGSQAYNDKLALKRAEVVSEIFQKYGVPREKITVEGLGKCCYKASPAQSRRVEITIRKKQTNQGG